ncbi:MAG: hypothetical protein HQL22_06950 [Candidatus Omnitrophica bacterium]|nr:hypothetical protein [Candidatus Omnitrophota bacterium]
MSRDNTCDAEITVGESQWEKEREEEQRLLEQYRQEFCLSDKEGTDYLLESQNLKDCAQLVQKIDRQNNDPDYKKAQSLKKLPVLVLEKQLGEALQKDKYLNLRLGNPEIDKYVIIPFTVQEGDQSRQGRSSELRAQRVIKDALADTNWRLMSQGLSYRLGCLSGQLKGYESEDELLGLIKLNNS